MILFLCFHWTHTAIPYPWLPFEEVKTLCYGFSTSLWDAVKRLHLWLSKHLHLAHFLSDIFHIDFMMNTCCQVLQCCFFLSPASYYYCIICSPSHILFEEVYIRGTINRVIIIFVILNSILSLVLLYCNLQHLFPISRVFTYFYLYKNQSNEGLKNCQ